MCAYLTEDNELIIADFDALVQAHTVPADTESPAMPAIGYVQPEPPRAKCPECLMVLWANDLVRHLRDAHPSLAGAQ